MGVMAPDSQAPTPAGQDSPFLSNVLVVVGFAVIFTTFVTDTYWSWIIGGVMLIGGALWAGFSTHEAAARPAAHEEPHLEHGHGSAT